MAKIDVKIGVDNSGVVCGPNNGHVRGKGAEDRISWESKGPPFSLRFALIGGTGPASWPFEGAEEPVSGVSEFSRVLVAVLDPKNPPLYKYTVIIKDVPPLDPIIIVEK